MAKPQVAAAAADSVAASERSRSVVQTGCVLEIPGSAPGAACVHRYTRSSVFSWESSIPVLLRVMEE